MKCFTINSSWLRKFNIWSAEFYTLLEKEEYQEILNFSVEEIKEKVKSLNLSKEELKIIREVLRKKYKNLYDWFDLNLLEKKEIYRNYVFLLGGIRLYKNILQEEQETLKEKIKFNDNLFLKLDLKELQGGLKK